MISTGQSVARIATAALMRRWTVIRSSYGARHCRTCCASGRALGNGMSGSSGVTSGRRGWLCSSSYINMSSAPPPSSILAVETEARPDASISADGPA